MDVKFYPLIKSRHFYFNLIFILQKVKNCTQTRIVNMTEKDDWKWPRNKTENAEDFKCYIFFLHWIWPKMTTVNVMMSISMTEKDFWVL